MRLGSLPAIITPLIPQPKPKQYRHPNTLGCLDSSVDHQIRAIDTRTDKLE
ncbi:MAG: hypothetical protein M2R45_01955 [Verrucomicrobia subdivision 3 bacterium]|nr:hypothetical protein [Limisphaerales bacterium]MCS1416178.1 hypothetical protein [Limisphaerales bacterium]